MILSYLVANAHLARKRSSDFRKSAVFLRTSRDARVAAPLVATVGRDRR
jgi:hypothetical protein